MGIVALSSVYNYLYDSVASWFSSNDQEERDLRSLYVNGYPIVVFCPHVVINGGFVLKGSKSPELSCFVAREAEALKSLKHKNIIQFVAFDPKNNIIALEHLEGKDIFEWLVSNTKLPARPIFKQLLEVVGYIHRQGFVHGDVSVNNVQFNPRNAHITLFDFAGTGREEDLQVSFPSIPLIAPEQIVDARMQKASDIWGIAIILHSIFKQYGHPYKVAGENKINAGSHIWAMTQTTGESIPVTGKLRELNLDAYRKTRTTEEEYILRRELGAEYITVWPLDKETPEGALLAKMLRIFPEERITADAALEDPYFTDS